MNGPLWEWTHLDWYLDVMVIDDPRAHNLRRLADLGWIRLELTDTALTETSTAQDPETRQRLSELVSQHVTAMGHNVEGHSVGWASVGASPSDHERLRNVYDILWPTNDYAADAAQLTGMGRSRFRDAMHVATAIRYHGTGLVTEDTALRRHADKIAERYNSFALVTICEAAQRSIDAVTTLRRKASRFGSHGPGVLPDWP